jgi:hypothetical protein
MRKTNAERQKEYRERRQKIFEIRLPFGFILLLTRESKRKRGRPKNVRLDMPLTKGDNNVT